MALTASPHPNTLTPPHPTPPSLQQPSCLSRPRMHAKLPSHSHHTHSQSTYPHFHKPSCLNRCQSDRSLTTGPSHKGQGLASPRPLFALFLAPRQACCLRLRLCLCPQVLCLLSEGVPEGAVTHPGGEETGGGMVLRGGSRGVEGGCHRHKTDRQAIRLPVRQVVRLPVRQTIRLPVRQTDCESTIGHCTCGLHTWLCH